MSKYHPQWSEVYECPETHHTMRILKDGGGIYFFNADGKEHRDGSQPAIRERWIIGENLHINRVWKKNGRTLAITRNRVI